MKLNKIDEVWNSANPLFKWRFDLLSPRNFATMATWRNEIPFKKALLSLPGPCNLTKLRRKLMWIKSVQRVPPTFRLPKLPTQRLGRATNWAPEVVFSLFRAFPPSNEVQDPMLLLNHFDQKPLMLRLIFELSASRIILDPLRPSLIIVNIGVNAPKTMQHSKLPLLGGKGRRLLPP